MKPPRLHRNIQSPHMWCVHCRQRCVDCDCLDEPEYAPLPDYREKPPHRTPTGRTAPTQLESTWRHSHWRARRDKVAAALQRAGVSQNRLTSFCFCGARCTVEWSEKLQRHRCNGEFCKDRHCEPCMRAKAARIRGNIIKELERTAGSSPRNNHTYRFFTFTLKASDDPLETQIARLYDSFKNLRRGKLWSGSQTGGVVMLEVKWNKTHWHPHLHVVAGGNWIDKKDLVEAWHQVTGDSFIVDVRRLDREKDIANYVAKYITKGTSSEVWNDEARAVEWIKATKHVRAANTFGDWRGIKLTAPLETADDWQLIGRLDDLIRQSRTCNDAIFHALLSLRPPGDDAEELLTQM